MAISPSQPLRERPVVHLAAVAAHLFADPEHRRAAVAENPLERRPPLEQRTIAQVGAPVAQHIEHDEGDAAASPAAPSSQVDASLELLESGRLHRPASSATISPSSTSGSVRRRAHARQRGGHFRKLRRLLVAEPRPETDAGAAGRHLGDGADAVVFRFVDQVADRRVVRPRATPASASATITAELALTQRTAVEHCGCH